jgi:Flp pilus assembly protein TadG
MRRLRKALRGERGASAVLVAILILPLVGVAGLAVDVGVLYVERSQLQNGADAAALAVAANCAKRACPVATDTSIAASFATENANDRAVTVAEQEIDLTARTVTIKVTTLKPDGTTSIASNFAAAAGVEDSVTTVSATATAQWGEGSPILPLALSECEFTITGAADGESHWIRYDTNKECKKNPAEPPATGQFGWLTVNGSPLECAATIDPSGFVGSRPGNGGSPNDVVGPGEKVCDSTFTADLAGTSVYIPLADNSNGLTGTNLEWHVTQYGKFTLLGWNFSGGRVTRLPDLYEPSVPDADGGTCEVNCNGVHVIFEEFVPVGSLPGTSVAEAVRLIG